MKLARMKLMMKLWAWAEWLDWNDVPPRRLWNRTLVWFDRRYVPFPPKFEQNGALRFSDEQPPEWGTITERT